MTSKRKLITLTLREKFDVINEVKSGMKKKDVASKYGLPASTLSTIMKNSSKILQKCESSSNLSCKRQRSADFPDLEERLINWFKECRDHGIVLSGRILQEKADEISKSMGYDSFRASNGWLIKFKKRHENVLRGFCGESARNKLPNDMENYMQYHVMGSVAQVRMKLGCLPTKFECQSDQNAEEFLKRPHKLKTGKVLVECEEPLIEIGMDLEDHLDKFVIGAEDGTARMECTDDWSISNTDMETEPSLKKVTTNALVTVDKQTQASFKLLNRSKAVQTNAAIVDVSYLLHNRPSALTMKMPDNITICDQISSMSEQSHDIIYTVYNYLLKEYEYLKGLNLSAEELTPLGDTLSRTANATGVSVETVTAILVLKELEKKDSENEQITLEHNYHQTNSIVSQSCTSEKYKNKDSASVKKVAQRCKSEKNKNKVSASVKKVSQRCTSDKNKNKVSTSVKVTGNKRKRKRGKRWSRPKQKSMRLDSEFDDTTMDMNNESTDSADESVLLNLKNKKEINTNGLIENKSICHNRHMEQYREEEDYSIKEDIQEDSSHHSYNMQDELVLKSEVFEDDSNTEEEVENCVIADDSQDNNSPHSYNLQDELVLKCEVFDDNINESPSRAEGLTTVSSVVEFKVEREDDGMEL